MNNAKANDSMDRAWWALRIFFGAVPLVAGLDKYFNVLTDWSAYVNPLMTKIVPLSASTFLHIVAVIEIAAGIIVLTRWTRLGASCFSRLSSQPSCVPRRHMRFIWATKC